MIVAGVVAGLVLFVSGVIKLHEGNTSDGLKLLGAFGWLLYVWHKKWHGIKAIIYHQSGKPSPRQSS